MVNSRRKGGVGVHVEYTDSDNRSPYGAKKIRPDYAFTSFSIVNDTNTRVYLELNTDLAPEYTVEVMTSQLSFNRNEDLSSSRIVVFEAELPEGYYEIISKIKDKNDEVIFTYSILFKKENLNAPQISCAGATDELILSDFQTITALIIDESLFEIPNDFWYDLPQTALGKISLDLVTDSGEDYLKIINTSTSNVRIEIQSTSSSLLDISSNGSFISDSSGTFACIKPTEP